MKFDSLVKQVASASGNQGVGPNALLRFLSYNRSFGSLEDGEFTFNKGYDINKLTDKFMNFGFNEYNREYPRNLNGNTGHEFDAYDDFIKNEYKSMFGPKVKKNGAYGSYGDGVAFNGSSKQNPAKNAVTVNNASVGKTNQPINEIPKGLKLNTSKKTYNEIKSAVGDMKTVAPVAYFDKASTMNVTENLANTVIFHGGKAKMSKPKEYNLAGSVNSEVFGRLQGINMYDTFNFNLDSLTKGDSSIGFMNKVVKLEEANSTIVTNKSSMQRNLLNFEDTRNNLEELSKVVTNGGKFTVFDIEANSGINQYGHTVLGNITELASVTYNVDPKTKKATEEKVFNSVLGYTDDEYNEVKRTLNNLANKSKNEWSVEEKVLYDRMNIYSQSDIVGAGFEQQVIKAKGIEDIKTSHSNALKGAEKLRDVAKAQEVWMRNNNVDKTYSEYRQSYIQSFRNNLAENLAVGHNVGTYDIPMIDRKSVSTKDINYVDTLQSAWYSQNELGRSSIYHKDKRVKMPKGYGPATQSAITEAHGLKNKSAAAHIAINDVRENALLVLGEMFNPQVDANGTVSISNDTYMNKVMLPNMKQVGAAMDKTSAKYTGGNQVYYMDYTMQKGNTMDGALSFEYDPMTDSYKTFDGFRIGRNGEKIEDAGFPSYGPRKGALYQHEIFELEMNDKFKKQFMNINGASKEQADRLFQQYSTAEKMYLVKSREYMDLDELTKKLGSRELAEHYYNNRATSFTFETNKGRLGANLGVNVGDVVNGELIANEKNLRGLDFKRTDYNGSTIIKDTDNIDSNLLLNKIVNKSYDRTINDSAARKLRDLDYKKVTQLRNYQKYLTESEGIKGNNPLITRISQMVASGQEIKLTDQEEIINSLGWHDWKKKDNKIIKETLNNALAMDAHVMQMSPLIDAITETLDDTYGKLDLSTPEAIQKISNDPKLKEILYKKDMAFKQMYNSYLDDVVSNPVIANSWKETLHTGAELNKIDFDDFKINPSKYRDTFGGWSRNASTQVASLNLNSPNSLINLFYNGKFNDLDTLVRKDGNAGFQALTDAYHFIRDDSRFAREDGSKIFDGINLKNYRGSNISQLNDDMMKELRGFAKEARGEISSWGYINPRMNQDILGSSGLIDYVSSQGKDAIKEKLQSYKGDLVKDLTVIDKDHASAANKLVDDYFLNFSFDKMDLDNFTSQQKAYASKQYDVARRTAQDKADSLLKAIKGTDIQLAMTETKHGTVLNLIEGNKVTQLDDMFKFNHRKGVMTYQLGDNEYALKLGLGRDKLNKNEYSNFKFTNTVNKITSGHLDHMNAEWAVQRGDSIAEAIAYNTKKTASLLRDASARIDVSNGQLLSQGFHFDINEMLYAMPELIENKTIDKLEQEFGIPKEAREQMRKVARDIGKSRDKYKDKTFTKVLPVELNFFTDHYMAPLLETVIKDNFTKEDQLLLGNVGFDVKNSALARGNASGVKSYLVDPLAKMDNDDRPPVTQMQNTRLYDKERTNAEVNNLKASSKIYDNLNATSVYTSDNMEKFMFNNKSSTGKVASNGLTMKYMQIDSYSLRNQFLDTNNQDKMAKYIENAFGEFSKDDATRAKEVVLDRAKRLSTYEQQSAMDARVHDINFHRSNTQTINAKKKMIADHKDNLDVIDYVENGKSKLHFEIGPNGEIKYDLGAKVKRGQVLGVFGNDQFSQTVQAKADGMFRGRYFDTHGNVVSERNLLSVLKEHNVDLTNNEAILDKLNSSFTFKYQVLGMEEMHGSKGILGASEKTTIDSMKLGIGEIDSGIVDILKKYNMDDIAGKVVSKDYLDEVVSRELKQKVGSKKSQEIMNRIYDERYAFSDAVHQIDAFKDVNFITNLDATKHSSATMLMHNALNELRDGGNLTNEYLDDIFGKGTYEILGEGKNATVKFNENLKTVQLEFDKDKNPVLHAAFNKDTRVYDANGNAIGHTGIGNLVSLYDDSAGTVSGVIDGEVRGKGVKFTDAMGRNLDRQTYNKDGLQKVYDHYKDLGQLDEFKATYGHALDMNSFKNGQLAFNESYGNTSMAASVTERLRSQLIKSDFGDTLADVKGNSKYNYLTKTFAEGSHGNVSVDRAEIMYSYTRGLEAMKMNALQSEAVVEGYTGRKDIHKAFREVDWSVDSPDWLDLQIGGQGRTVTGSDMNPYTNNLVIKTGLGKDNEYLAIARMPEVHAGDSLIQKKHQQMLTGFQQKMQLLKKGEISKDKVIDHMNMIKTQMVADVTGKKGLIKDLTEFRMNQSFMGKGSGMVMAALDNEGNSLFGGDKLGIESRVAKLDDLNHSSLKNAMFNGKSLNRHYAEGRVVDSLFMSEEAFKGMGYFDKDFMEKTLGDLNSDAMQSLKNANIDMSDQEAQMRHLLSTQGDAFVSVRYPEIMQGSDKFAMGYLDTTLKANEMKVVGPTGMSAKLDFDGDTMNAARVTTSDGLSRLNAVTGKHMSEELLELQRSVDTSISTRAVTDNAFWERKVQDFMTGKKGLETMSKAMDINQIASHKLVNGKAYLDAANGYSESEMYALRNKYNDVLSRMSDGEFKTDGKRDDSLLVNAINEAAGITNASDESAIQEFVVAKAHQDRQNMVKAKIYNNAIGETNVTNQTIKSVISGVLPKDSVDYEYQSNLLFDFLYQAEEQAISSKSSIEGLTSDRAQQWNRSVSSLITGKGNTDQHLKDMRGWLDQNLRGNMASELYYAKSDTFTNKIADKFNVYSLDDFREFTSVKANQKLVDDILIDDIISMTKNAASIDGIGKTYESLKTASSSAGSGHRIAQNMNFIKDQETNLRYVYEAVNGTMEENLSSLLDIDDTKFHSGKAFRSSIEETISSASQTASKVSTEDVIGGIIEGVGDFAKSVKGKGLAKGAIGIAAGIMVAGYVGGRPRPADVHAMEEAQDYQAPMDGYQLADPGMAMASGQQGYVVNINARTNRGRENAIQALQQAIASGGSSNINVAMNITDDYGNINDRQIEEAILGAF